MCLFNAQDLPENLNMAKMSLSSTISEKPSTGEKEEDSNGIHKIQTCYSRTYLSVIYVAQHIYIKPFQVI